MAEEEKKWAWFASGDEEIYTVGPENTRESVIQAALGDELGLDEDTETGNATCTFHIMEALQAPIICFADYFVAKDWLEGLLDYQFEEDGSFFRPITGPMRADLETRVRAVITSWQADNKIEIRPWAFRNTRGGEWVTITLPIAEPTQLKPAKDAE